jgi:hypothetical protein
MASRTLGACLALPQDFLWNHDQQKFALRVDGLLIVMLSLFLEIRTAYVKIEDRARAMHTFPAVNSNGYANSDSILFNLSGHALGPFSAASSPCSCFHSSARLMVIRMVSLRKGLVMKS